MTPINYVYSLLITGTATDEISELTRSLLGATSELVSKTFSLIVLLGANIVYWILMSNFLYHSVHYFYSKFNAGGIL